MPATPRSLPYGRQTIEDDDIREVIDVLRSDWLTTGPKVVEFEAAIAKFVGVQNAVAVSNGTAALHTAMFGLGIGAGDEVIVPTMTFAASANAVVYQRATPVFCDVIEGTLLIDPRDVEKKITPSTKAIVAVDYAGQVCDYKALRAISARHNLRLIADASHALGAAYRDGEKVGAIADVTTFSFHPVKHIATGEGGMVTTNSAEVADRMRRFRNHGITSDHRQRESLGTYHYEMIDLGYNYRLSDIQCALGLSQLRKLPGWLDRRRAIARRYDEAFGPSPLLTALDCADHEAHAYHIYVVKLDLAKLNVGRREIFGELRERGLGVNVHYMPVHLHPYYRASLGTAVGSFPIAEDAYERILTLPLFPSMTSEDVEYVIASVLDVLQLHMKPGVQ